MAASQFPMALCPPIERVQTAGQVKASEFEARAPITGGVVTRKVDKRTDTQRYACCALNAASIVGLLTALILWSGGPPPTKHYAPQSLAATPPVGTPACPRCSRYMVHRRARRGPHAGQFFWGCSACPSCRGTRNATTPNPYVRCQVWRGECGVVGWLVHKVCWSRLRVFPGALPLPYLLVGLFPAALTPIRACDRSRSSNLINAISGRGT